MLKQILYWTDDKMEQILSDPNEKHPYAKGYRLGAIVGAIEGVLEGLVIGKLISIVINGIAKAINSKKK